MLRRRFLGALGACAAHLMATSVSGAAATRRRFAARPRGPVVLQEPWGRLEQLGEGLWALISTPLNDNPRARMTVANGGIVAGRDGVVLVEGLVSEAGARWLADAARELTGRRPDHVVLTHYHSDHSNGLSALGTDGGVVLHASATTLETLSLDAEPEREAPTSGFDEGRLRLADEAGPSWIDLGDRRLEIRPASGHTQSDLFVLLEDPAILWCGDLVWNGLVPNYMDAIPSRLSTSVRELAAEPCETWVPGHGDLADRSALDAYLALIDDIEDAARRAIAAGDPPEAAAAEYAPPESLGEWVTFSPRYYEVAFRAWQQELNRR